MSTEEMIENSITITHSARLLKLSLTSIYRLRTAGILEHYPDSCRITMDSFNKLKNFLTKYRNDCGEHCRLPIKYLIEKMKS